jgi:hypothetical protein
VVFVLMATAAGAAFAAGRYNAPPVAPDFTIGATTVPLSGRCAPDRVARHLILRLEAFDSGRARAFSRGFPASVRSARWIFNPYAGEALPGYRASLRTRPGIERIVRALYRRGDGWTATRLGPPTGAASPPGRAIYGLSLRVTRRGFQPYDAGVKVIVACDSGRITRWNGPIGPSG